MANKFFGAINLIGGTDGALDDIDDTVIEDLDGAYVIDSVQRFYTYNLDASSGAAEDSPRIIAPNTGSNKRWLINSIIAKSVVVAENAEYVYGTDTGDNEEGLLRINSSDDTEVRAQTGNSVDIMIHTTKVADFAAAGLTLSTGATLNEFSTDGTLAGNSDVAAPTEKATKTYADAVGTTAAGLVTTHEADTSTHGVAVVAGTADIATHAGLTATHGVAGAIVGTTDIQTLSNKTLTSPVLNTGLSGTAFLDEDNMVSDSATKVSSQQSIKKYVDDAGVVLAGALTTHEADTSTHGVAVIAGTADIATHAGLTATHGVGEIADAADLTTHMADTSTHGVGTVADAADLTTHMADTSTHGVGTVADAADLTTHMADTSTHGVTTITGLTEVQVMSNKTLTSPVLNTGISGTAFLDEDNMASNSATKVASQQSIKAYADAITTAFGAADTAHFADTSTHGVGEVADAADLTTHMADVSTHGIGTAIVGTTEVQTLTNKTLTSPAITAPAITGATTIGTGATITSPIINTILAKTAENGIVITADGSVALYHDNVKTFETTAAGADIFDASGTNPVLYFKTDAGAINASIDSTNLQTILKVGTAEENAVLAKANSWVYLYYNGNKAFGTETDGISVFSTTGSDPKLRFRTNGSVVQGSITWDWDASFILSDDVNNDNYITGAANGSVVLFYNGTSHFSTIDDGVEITVAGGCLTIPEVTTPTADANKGKIYTKNDNKLYFQDGAGSEHEMSYIDSVIPSGTQMLFYSNTAIAGWTLVVSVDDKVVFVTKGSVAGGETGGGAHSSGSWTISNINAANESAHTHSHNHRWYDARGANLDDYSFNSGGSLTVLSTTTTGIAAKRIVISDGTTFPSADMYNETDATTASAHTHTVTHTPGWRPAAACFTLQQKI